MKTILTVAAALLGATLASTAWSKDDPAAGAQLYATNCTACHGADRAGVPGAFPALTDVGKRLDSAQIKEKISKGGGLMPPFPQLSQQDVDNIASFLAQ
ncbi:MULTISPECIES: c-type cytochrome [Xanthomonas]|uniref:c-type cytochrome n=1 Tax=Xanthomonas TaxID=338 RepID=UPI0015CC6292|nr:MULTISPECIES: cytochrome c [Xanthomonas]MBD7922955.1 cytochrome c [Xanthomonas surreyensis]MBN6111736.1 cytochrome c [Xanthomonas bonasiae]NYF20141.1 mono/diheme cytochrome c family protein [Xanthomonas sp. JAI131]